MATANAQPRLYRQIADDIRALISAGKFKAGMRLPPERDLAKMLGVSRPSVREALIALEVEGAIEVRVGSGIYVMKGGGRRGKRGDDEIGPLEVLDARWLIEGECAALAAQAISDAQIAELERIVETSFAEGASERKRQQGDLAFHLLIAEATGNAALMLVVRTLWEQRTGRLYGQMEAHFNTPEMWRKSYANHRQIVRALKTHDPEKAAAAMRNHIGRVHREFASKSLEHHAAQPAAGKKPRGKTVQS